MSTTPIAHRADILFERAIFASRWLMAPMYAGLVIALFMLMVIFMHDLYAAIVGFGSFTTDQAIIVVLTFVDLSMAGNLVLVVMFSGYENFIARINLKDDNNRLSWMGKVDFAGLKIKLIASIVAISGIHLLKRFMEIGKEGKPLIEEEIYWMVIIHMVFVFSGVFLTLMDYLRVLAVTRKGNAET